MLDLSEFFIIEKDGVPINDDKQSKRKRTGDVSSNESTDALLFKITKEASKPIQTNKEADELWLNKTKMAKILNKWM